MPIASLGTPGEIFGKYWQKSERQTDTEVLFGVHSRKKGLCLLSYLLVAEEKERGLNCLQNCKISL